VRLLLELAEEAIAADPWHRVDRVDLGNDIVCDLSERGIMLTYRVVADEILFLTFRDLAES